MTSPFLRLTLPWFGATAALFVASAVAPLMTYSVSLAVFGLPHVFAELRYVDRRFTERLPRGLAPDLLGPLVAICGLRIANIVAPTRFPHLPAVELALVALLVLFTVPRFVGRSISFLLLAAIGSAMLGLASWLAPVSILVTFAFLHNLTPVLFVVERLDGEDRRRFLRGPATIAFLALPLMIALGIPQWVIGEGMHTVLDRDLIGAGELRDHLGAFAPSFLGRESVALHLFQAATMLQGLHYLYVLRVLPSLVQEPTTRTMAPWPARHAFTRALVVMGMLSLALFLVSFGETRRTYGVFAAFHAWIEWPLLLLGLGGALESGTAAPPEVRHDG